MLVFFTLYVVYNQISQIRLNIPMDNHHLSVMTKLKKRTMAPIGNIKEVLRVGLISRMEEVDKPQPPKEHKQRAPKKKASRKKNKNKNKT